MDAKKNGNEPAYARPVSAIEPGRLRDYEAGHSGLTKRELFAAMAMQGLLSQHGLSQAEWNVGRGGLTFNDAAAHAVKLADALLVELAKGDNHD